ncbi:MAG: thioesterase family protein [Clostridiales bacterium]|nr:thioesterase family protein [Clostridiales bacterium]
MEVGIKGKKERVVPYEQTAEYISSGLLPVFATPCMIQFMEETARVSVEPFLNEGQSTVGTSVNIKHLASTFVGCKVTCESELIEIDRRRLVFNVKVYDDKELLGEGVHERFIIDNAKFIARLDVKKQEMGL